MSRTPQLTIGCPDCDTIVAATVPSGNGVDGDHETVRLQGGETVCRNCGHEFGLYYY